MTPTSSLVTLVEEERREWAGLQALRERVVRQERHGARAPALPLQGVRPQLHGHAAPRQAACDEGAGGAALRPGQRQPGHDRQAARGQPRRRLQVGPRGRRGCADTLGHAVERHRPDRRDVALRERRNNKVWVWRAYDPVVRRTLAWELGGRDDATCRVASFADVTERSSSLAAAVAEPVGLWATRQRRPSDPRAEASPRRSRSARQAYRHPRPTLAAPRGRRRGGGRSPAASRGRDVAACEGACRGTGRGTPPRASPAGRWPAGPARPPARSAGAPRPPRTGRRASARSVAPSASPGAWPGPRPPARRCRAPTGSRPARPRRPGPADRHSPPWPP